MNCCLYRPTMQSSCKKKKKKKEKKWTKVMVLLISIRSSDGAVLFR